MNVSETEFAGDGVWSGVSSGTRTRAISREERHHRLGLVLPVSLAPLLSWRERHVRVKGLVPQSGIQCGGPLVHAE